MSIHNIPEIKETEGQAQSGLTPTSRQVRMLRPANASSDEANLATLARFAGALITANGKIVTHQELMAGLEAVIDQASGEQSAAFAYFLANGWTYGINPPSMYPDDHYLFYRLEDDFTFSSQHPLPSSIGGLVVDPSTSPPNIYGLPVLTSNGHLVYGFQIMFQNVDLHATYSDWMAFAQQEFVPEFITTTGSTMVGLASLGEIADVGYELTQRGVQLTDWPAVIINLDEWTPATPEMMEGPIVSSGFVWFYVDSSSTLLNIGLWPDVSTDLVPGLDPLTDSTLTVFRNVVYLIN